MAKGRKTGGRAKGVRNKTTASMRQAWVEAFDQLGGVGALVDWARTNPDDFYKCVTKLIPQDITTGGNAMPAGVLAVPVPLNADAWGTIAAAQQATVRGIAPE